MPNTIRLKKLYDLLEKLKQSELGEDWQYQHQLMYLEEKVKEEIRHELQALRQRDSEVV